MKLLKFIYSGVFSFGSETSTWQIKCFSWQMTYYLERTMSVLFRNSLDAFWIEILLIFLVTTQRGLKLHMHGVQSPVLEPILFIGPPGLSRDPHDMSLEFWPILSGPSVGLLACACSLRSSHKFELRSALRNLHFFVFYFFFFLTVRDRALNFLSTSCRILELKDIDLLIKISNVPVSSVAANKKKGPWASSADLIMFLAIVFCSHMTHQLQHCL